ncbi:hypothetical protein F8M41_004617 [Gigaspora margarita]|uniref:Uncharacterized protein n=1 Tax=Gigaspora margarita TaxID=4874 RepID=A0A8H3XCG9_GIGMA|nr:hypothetical protein F8M41_004617 [Gigaspora margarita]
MVGAYPEEAKEEICLEEVNLQEQVEEPNQELVESEEETSEKEASEEEPEDFNQEELIETEEEPEEPNPEELRFSDSESDATVEDPESERNMAEDAINAAAAITALVDTMGRGSKKSLLKIDFYHGDETQDPVTWIEEFE